VIIAYLRGLEEAVHFVNHLVRDGAVLGCCPLNVAEVYAGMKGRERAATEELIDSFRFFPVDLEAAKLAGDIIRSYRSKGVTLALADAAIAALAIQNGLLLATYNEKHYPMTELTLICPANL
jgi:predicted nucleic acid-binding protein